MMNMQMNSKKRRPLPVVLGIGIPSFLALLVVAGSLLFFHVGAASASSLKVAPGAKGSPASIAQGPTNHGGEPPSSTQKSASSPLHAQMKFSGGGCWSFQTSSPDATFASNGEPPMYGFENSDASQLGLALNSCDDTIQVTMTGGYDYYKIDWWRPGRNGWTEYRSGSSVSNFGNAHFGTTYEFVVDACTSHWYGDSCNSWSPRVYISTN